MRLSATLVLIFLSLTTVAQIVPLSRQVDWSLAGYNGIIPSPSQIVDVTTFGAVGDGVTNDRPSILNAINSLSGPGVIYFPPGNYLVDNHLNLTSGVILRGAGADSSIISFDFNGGAQNCIDIFQSQSAPWSNASFGFTKGSTKIVVDSIQNFSPGSYCELVQDNGAWDTHPAVWAMESIGQIFKVLSISGDTLLIDHALRYDYSMSLNPRLRMINPVQNVGIECLALKRVDSPIANGGYNIYMSYAVNCWLRGIESNKSIWAHALVLRSSNISVTGSYFHDAYEFTGSSTKGYGFVLAEHSGECLIENNIFRRLRHAMMIKQGANGNVFAYNYSIEPNRSEFPSNAGGDISLHGHFPYANLFEENICQNIVIDQAWGASGPDNLFFRNRADLYGIVMSSGTLQSNDQLFVGNEVTNAAFPLGNYVLVGTGHLEHGNNIKGTITPAGTGTLSVQSFYGSAVPSFWNINSNWPAIGIPNILNTGDIPARDRFLNATVNTVCSNLSSSLQTRSDDDEDFLVYPNPSDGFFNINHENLLNVEIFFANGQYLDPGFYSLSDEILEIHTAGLYIVRLMTRNQVYHRQIIVR